MGFWDTVGKITTALMDEAGKRQNEMKRQAGNQLKEYERKLTNARNSGNMSNPVYAQRVNKAKQQLEQAKKKVYGESPNSNVNRSTPEVGSASLKDIANPYAYINKPGVYILRVNGRIMKVGSAMIGVQKRMQQYYGLNQSCGLSHITESNRDSIHVTYQHCPIDKCTELESKLFDKYGGVGSMPWAERRPHSSENTYQLKI